MFRSVNMVWFKCQTMAGAPAGAADGLNSEQCKCEERVFFPSLGPTPHLSQPPSGISGGRERKEAVRKVFQCGFQGRFPGPGDTSAVTENALTRNVTVDVSVGTAKPIISDFSYT